MHKSTLARLSTSVMIPVLLLAGCGQSSAAHRGAASGSKDVTVALPVQVSPNWWFPLESTQAFSSINGQMNYLMYKPLLDVSHKDTINYKRSLASQVKWNNNATVYTITLNPKWHWSNGQPVTAQDAVFTIDLMLAASGAKNQTPPWQYGGAGIGGTPSRWRSVKARGSDTVVITLNQPSNPQWFLHNGLGQIEVVPRSVWDLHKNTTRELQFIQSVANKPAAPYYQVVDGPFKFSASASKTNNQYWTFVPNPRYDGHRASISKLVYMYEASPASVFGGLKTGSLTVGYLPPSLWNSRNQLTQDVMAIQYPFGFNYLLPNLSSKAPGGSGQLFSQLYIRQAFQMGIDQPGIIRVLYHEGVVEYSPIPSKPTTAFFDARLHNHYPFDPAAGKKLLESHGWKPVHGIMTRGNQKLQFTADYVSGSNTVAHEMELIKNDLAQEGIIVNLVSQPFNTLIATATPQGASHWQLVNWGQGWTYVPDYFPTGGGLFSTNAAANYGSYSSQVMNHLVQETYQPGTPQQIQSRMNAYQHYAATNLPVIWLPWIPTFAEHASYLQGINTHFNPVTDVESPNYWTVH